MIILSSQLSHPNLSSILIRKKAEKHFSYYLIVYETSALTIQYMSEMLDSYFWNNGIFNAVIFYWSTYELHIFTYFPYTKILQQLSNSNLTSANLFPEKLTNLYGHRLNVSQFSEVYRTNTPDKFILQEILKKLNATMIFIPPLANETGFQSANRLIRTLQADISLNLRFIRTEFIETKFAEFIVFGRDDICILVPMSLTKKQEIFLTLIRSLYMRCSVTILIIVCIVYHMTIQVKRYELKQKNRTIWFDIVQLYFNAGIHRFPDRGSQRILISVWMIFCMIQSMVFSCVIVSGLINTVFIKEIDTISELGEANLTILTVDNMDYITKKGFIGKDRKFLNNMINSETEIFLNLLNESYPTMAIATSQHAPFYEKLIQLGNRKRVYYQMTEIAVPFLAGYFVPYGSRYLHQFTRIVQHLMEGGFFNRWNRNWNKIASAKNEEPKPLKLHHFQLFVIILLMGYALGLVVFIGEILFSLFTVTRKRVIINKRIY